MTGALTDRTQRHIRTRTVMAVLLMAIVAFAAIVLAGFGAGLRVNMTPSEPLGLWRIRPLNRPAMIGDLVFICPPQTEAMRLARRRGYLRGGLCPGGYAPLIKTIVGVAGQRVSIGRSVSIGGVPLVLSRLADVDGKGRPLKPALSGVIPANDVFLHADFLGSFDSRYFGPVPISGILGFADEVLTYAP